MQQRMNLEDRMRKARQCVIEKLDRFDGRDISKFFRAYEEAMEDNGIDDSVAIKNFYLIVKPELRGPIEELQGQHSVSWRNFKVVLKTEYFLEDSQRVTKQTFIKWVQMKNKGLTSRELLQEFEKKFDQLSTGEQQSLKSEKVELFVQAADSRLQKNLVQLLEDPTGELGLTNDWDAVPAAINLLLKRQKRIDKSIVVDSHEDFEENGIAEKIEEKLKASSSPMLEGKKKPKATQTSTLDDSTMDDLIKGIQELNLNLKAVRLEKSSSSKKPKDILLSLEVLKLIFEDQIINNQTLLQFEERSKKLLNMIPDDARWKQLKYLLEPGKQQASKFEVQCAAKRAYLLFNSLNVQVSKHTNRLLKAPFCLLFIVCILSKVALLNIPSFVSMKTSFRVCFRFAGRVCVPIDPKECDNFDPLAVPTVADVPLFPFFLFKLF
ncbi:hypothetical protein L7F22_063840 [Adiantum nelumboides]|nr:hypothetical protein [Adiantum nelumboides]